MRAYFDACIIIDIGLGGERAAGMLAWAIRAAPLDPIFSDFARGEVAGAIAQQVRADRITAGQALSTLAVIDEGLASWRHEPIVSEDIRAATELLLHFDLNLRFPDAIHLAAARRHGAMLVTCDRKLVAAALRLGSKVVDPLAPKERHRS